MLVNEAASAVQRVSRMQPAVEATQPPAPGGDAASGLLSIADVERETGLSKDTLRMWERRYGFPLPLRDRIGERRYGLGDVQRLRLIKRLLDTGHRPGRVVALSQLELEVLGENDSRPRAGARHAGAGNESTPRKRPQGSAIPVRGGGPLDARWMAWVQGNQPEALRQAMHKHLLERGLVATVEELIAPLSVQVGEAWLAGRLTVFQEHLFSEVVQTVCREALTVVDVAHAVPPRVLLTTLAGERHSLGLLVAECFLALEGCERLALGPATPLDEIIEATRQLSPDVIALSVSAHAAPRAVLTDLRYLRERLGSSIEIWAGGNLPVLHRKPLGEGIVALRRAADIGAQVARWREGHADANGSKSRSEPRTGTTKRSKTAPDGARGV